MTSTRRVTDEWLRCYHWRTAKRNERAKREQYAGHRAGSYHFVIAVWRAREAKSAHYENDNSPVRTFNESRSSPACFGDSTRSRLLCACAGSACDLPRRLLDQQ